ncbi:MAG: hypothetical protein U5K56_17150 [Halioglobus sp.]|nr:hypothetical protein [Halioglobus sp.]
MLTVSRMSTGADLVQCGPDVRGGNREAQKFAHLRDRRRCVVGECLVGELEQGLPAQQFVDLCRLPRDLCFDAPELAPTSICTRTRWSLRPPAPE